MHGVNVLVSRGKSLRSTRYFGIVPVLVCDGCRATKVCLVRLTAVPPKARQNILGAVPPVARKNILGRKCSAHIRRRWFSRRGTFRECHRIFFQGSPRENSRGNFPVLYVGPGTRRNTVIFGQTVYRRRRYRQKSKNRQPFKLKSTVILQHRHRSTVK